MRIFPHKLRVCAVPFPRPRVKFVRLSLSCYVMRTSPYKHQFCAVLFSRLLFKFTRLYWSCFVVCVFRFAWFSAIRLVNAGFVVVAGCVYSLGSACFMYFLLCFRDFSCYLHPVWRPAVSFSIVALVLPDLAPFLLSVQPSKLNRSELENKTCFCCHSRENTLERVS